MKLIRNAIQCKHCNELIISTHVHDYRTCKCGTVAVDGGNEYSRRTFKQDGDYTEACIWKSSVSDERSEMSGKFLVWCPSGKSNPSSIFDRVEDASTTAAEMSKRFGVAFYTVLILADGC